MDRVLHITGGMNRAGAETMLMNVYRTIDRQKVQFDFLVYSDLKQDYEDEIQSLGGRVIHLSENNIIKLVSSIDNVIKEYGPYIAVHAHTMYNSAFAMLAAIKTDDVIRITHCHCTQAVIKSKWNKKIYNYVTSIIIKRKSQKWIACGEEAGEYLFGKRFRDKGIVINNGVDLSLYNHRNSECDLLIKKYELQDKLVIGSIARFVEVKNHRFMIQIASELKQRGFSFKMLLIGRGELLESIQREIEEKKLFDCVLLLGVRSDIADILQIMDVFIMPSFFEGNPVTLIEAQASGVHCVVSDVITSQIDMGLGLIHKCSLENGVKLWADTIIQYEGRKEKNYDKIKQAFIEKEYDAHSMARKMLELYGDNEQSE